MTSEVQSIPESILTEPNFIIMAAFFVVMLNVTLFFKIWGMTSDVLRIRILLENLMDERKKQTDQSSSNNKTKG